MKIKRILLLLTVLLTACGTWEADVASPTAGVSNATEMPTATETAVSSPTPTLTPLPPPATPTLEPTPTTTAMSPSPTPTAVPLPSTFTPTPAPAAERLLFAPGATQASVEGYLPQNTPQVYVMNVAAGQYVAIDAAVETTGQGLRCSIVGADGTVVWPLGDAHVRIVVPTTQDYYIELVSDVGPVNYGMSVLIPVRVRLASGATSTQIDGSLTADVVRHYVLHVQAGQRMIVEPQSTRGQVRLMIWGADGQVFLSGRVGPPDGIFDGVLPITQDYLIAVQSEGGTDATYTLDITIPPL